MTLNLADAIVVIDAQTKLIKQQSLEISELQLKLEQKEYNKRYTNTKFIAGIDAADRLHKEVKRK